MSKPFHPHQPEKKTREEVTVRESKLLETLRKVEFGKVTIHKSHGVLVRVETTHSQILDEE